MKPFLPENLNRPLSLPDLENFAQFIEKETNPNNILLVALILFSFVLLFVWFKLKEETRMVIKETSKKIIKGFLFLIGFFIIFRLTETLVQDKSLSLAASLCLFFLLGYFIKLAESLHRLKIKKGGNE